MRVEVIVSPGEFANHDLTGKTAVVIDVFRFTTTILTALEAGIESFYPVKDVEEAFSCKRENPQLLLAGERNALPIQGFDFGNSPLDHVGKSYGGEKLVCCTTNGTKAIYAAKGASEIILASIRSAQAVANYLVSQNREVVFLPAGLHGMFSLEDTWCAGLILSYLPVTEWGDGAKVAQLLQAQIPVAELSQSVHGRRLQSLDLQADLAYCLERNVSSAVVYWDQKTGWGALRR